MDFSNASEIIPTNDLNVNDWMKKTFEKFQTKGNYNGSPDNGNAVRKFLYNLKLQSAEIEVIPKSSHWYQEDELYCTHWDQFLVVFGIDETGEFASRPGPILHSFHSFQEAIEHIDKNIDVYSLKKSK